jgi:hypothetical protein
MEYRCTRTILRPNLDGKTIVAKGFGFSFRQSYDLQYPVDVGRFGRPFVFALLRTNVERAVRLPGHLALS